ncbi:flagellin [Geobacillus thermoleovorans]|uniref:flagellin N-terminal helical domain-containing protein n=1 Tax=Geobacillus thermoleovorans TaxID=33941 RepID=UPI003DA31C9D
MRINHNIAALNTYRQLTFNNTQAAKNIEKLSSGLRINRAGDDAAGLAISEKMRGQIRGLEQAARNAQDAISMIQTAEGALNETHSILQRMRELAVQAANGTATDADRAALQDELNNLTSEINRIGNTTEFNTQKLLNGGMGSNGGAKIRNATSASITAVSAMTAGTVGSVKVTVDNITFNLSGATLTDATTATSGLDANDYNEFITELGNKTAGGVKLSDLVNITVDSNGILTFEAKSKGASSFIAFSGADSVLGLNTAVSDYGDPTTIERHGLSATTALDSGDVTISADSTFKITVGSESAVEVTLKGGKTYDTENSDANVAKAEMQELIKDINAALQEAGLDGKVTAALSKDNKVQFISETGKDITVEDGTGTPLAALGFTSNDMTNVKNIDQVVGSGAQGSGFNTKFQIGANTGQSMSLTINDMRAAALGITGNAGQAGFTSTNTVTNGTNDIKVEAALNISNKEDASKAIEVIDKAIQMVSAERGKLGAVQNRLEHTINNLGTASENLTAAESRIRDVDMAKEMMEFTKNNILSQAAQAMLAQSNQIPQAVLQLLR